MGDNIFGRVSDSKEFERLCEDLVEAEGYNVVSEPRIDTDGIDFVAVKEYRAHDGSSIRQTWLGQCKHYAKSGRSLSRKETEEIIHCYEGARKPNEGLLILIDTDYTEPAKRVIDTFQANHPDAPIEAWNRRQLRARLERHPDIIARYGMNTVRAGFTDIFADLKGRGTSALIVSDQSALAHDVASILHSVAFDVAFLPFWNYQHPSRFQLMASSLRRNFDMIVVFLGDSFGLGMPPQLVEIIRSQHEAGASILLWPFVAWSMKQGAYHDLDGIVPVRLANRGITNLAVPGQAAGQSREGDFRWLLATDSFAEDQYVEYDPADGMEPFTRGNRGRFGISHSFECLELVDGARCVWSDTTGNPFIATRENGPRRVCYINSTCHSCMSTVPIASPLEASPAFAQMLRNVLGWLLNI